MGNEAGKQKKFQKQMDELNDAAFQMNWQAKSLEKEANRAMAQREVQMKKAKAEMDKGLSKFKHAKSFAVHLESEGH